MATAQNSTAGVPAVEFFLLGPLEVRIAGEPVAITRKREAAVLARLLVSAGSAVSDQELVESVWGNNELKDPVHALRAAVSRVRGILARAGDELITRTALGYRLDMSSATTDAERFEQLVQRANASSDPHRRVDLLNQALDLWRGPPLAEFAGAHFAMAASIRLEEQRRNAMDAQLIARLEIGDDATLIPELEQTLAEHPMREELWRALMLALYRAGRQGEALRGFQRARQALASFGLDPGPRLRHMEEAILRQDPALYGGGGRHDPSTVDPGPDTRLPAIDTSFVGRGSDVATLADVVRRERFVTVTGPAGVGKSRLAIEVARTVQPSFGDGVCHVDLHAYEGGDDLAAAVQSGLGVWAMLQPGLDAPGAAISRLVETLRTKDHLLVLDGCERAAGGTARLAGELLDQCPRLHVLATSTTPLARDDEVVYQISPLPVDRTEPASSETDGAMKLFADRARLVVSGFAIGDDNREVIADIVTKLDGLPLAIELAAARSGSLPLTTIAQRLDSLLRSESSAVRRGRTMEATLRWSYEQLPPRDREIFDGVSTLIGAWDIEAAAAVCRAESSVIEAAVARLINLSLLNRVADPSNGERYSMLGVVRTFGLANLEAVGLSQEMAGRAAGYVRRELRARASRLAGPDEGRMLAWFRHSIEDLVAGFDWLLDNDPAGAVEGAALAGWFWIRLGYPNAARGSHSPKLQLGAAPPQHAALASLLACWTTLLSQPVKPGSRQFVLPLVESRATFGREVDANEDADSPVAWAERALELFGEAGDERGTAAAMSGLALAMASDGRFEEAAAVAGEAIDKHRRAGSGRWDVATSLLVAANVALGRGDLDVAVALASESLEVFVEWGDGFMAAWNHDTLARAAIVSGRLDDAEGHWIEALAHRPNIHPARVLIACWLGLLKMNAGLFDEAASYFADALTDARAAGTGESMVTVRLCLGEWHSQRGDTTTARAMNEEAAKLAHRGDTSLADTVHLAFAVADVSDQDFDSARRWARRALRSWAPDERVPAGTLDVLAACALAEDRATRAAVLSGAPDAAPGVLFFRILLGRIRAATHSGLIAAIGPTAAEEAAAVGRHLDSARMVAFALSDDDRPDVDGPHGVAPSTR